MMHKTLLSASLFALALVVALPSSAHASTLLGGSDNGLLNAISSPASVGQTVSAVGLPSGNASYSVGSGDNSSTSFYKNSDGTYSTVTTNSSGGGGNSNSGSQTSASDFGSLTVTVKDNCSPSSPVSGVNVAVAGPAGYGTGANTGSNGSVTFSGMYGGTYNWTAGGASGSASVPAGGSASASATVTRAGGCPAAPSCSISASPSTVGSTGGTVSISWSSSNTGTGGGATVWLDSPAAIQSSALSGSKSVSVAGPTSFHVDVWNSASQTGRCSASVGGTTSSGTTGTTNTSSGSTGGTQTTTTTTTKNSPPPKPPSPPPPPPPPSSSSSNSGSKNNNWWSNNNFPSGGNFNFSSAPGAPSVSLTADPQLVRSGGSTTIKWTSTGATRCSISGPSLSLSALSGTKLVSNITQASLYTLTCSNSGKTTTDTVRVSLVPSYQEK